MGINEIIRYNRENASIKVDKGIAIQPVIKKAMKIAGNERVTRARLPTVQQNPLRSFPKNRLIVYF
jgi:hypothetical protein